jgi:hypothetical protein
MSPCHICLFNPSYIPTGSYVFLTQTTSFLAPPPLLTLAICLLAHMPLLTQGPYWSLFLSNPGYICHYPSALPNSGYISLGPLPLLKPHLDSPLCLFQPRLHPYWPLCLSDQGSIFDSSNPGYICHYSSALSNSGYISPDPSNLPNSGYVSHGPLPFLTLHVSLPHMPLLIQATSLLVPKSF